MSFDFWKLLFFKNSIPHEKNDCFLTFDEIYYIYI